MNYMLKLVKSFCGNSVNDYMFIKHYNTLLLPEDEIREILDAANEKYTLLYYKYPKHEMLEPYQPFLGWIRKLYFEYFKDETPESFVANAKVYPLQQYSFAEYIKTGRASRIEDFLLNELGYENKRILRSLVNMYKYICTRTKLFVVIESLHLTNLSGIKALYQLMTSQNHGKLRMFATYNESYTIPDYIEGAWTKFIQEMEKQNYQYEWGNVDAIVTIDAQDIFVPSAEKMEDYLTIGRNMYYFLANQDALHYLNIIYDKIKHNNLKITQDQYVRFLQLLAVVEINCKEYSRALQLCEYVGVIGKENNDDRVLYNYNYICAMTQYGMEQLENKITSYVEKCMKIARKWGDELAEYKPRILQILSDCNYWRDIFIDHYGTYVNEEMIQKAEKYGLKNILAYIYIYCFETDEDELYKVASHEKDLPYFNQGVDLATEIENYDLLISAYTKNIIVFSRIGCYEYVSEMFEKKLEANNYEKNLLRMVHAYNGMGYSASITEKYQKAEEYFSNSIEQLLKLENGEEIAITLYNSALNKMLAREYGYASDDLLLLIKVMEMLGIHALSIADTARFYGMLGICSFYIGEDYRCFYCLNRIETYVSHLNYVESEEKYQYWIETLFLKNLLRGMLHVQNGKLTNAKERFDKAEFFMFMDKEKRYFLYFLYVQALSRYYEVLGDEEKRQNVLKEGIKYCDENGYHIRGSALMAELRKGHDVGKKGIILKRQVSNEEILEVIEKLALQTNLEASKKEITFLTVWQELLSKCENAEDIMPQTFNLLKNHFNFDGVFMIGVNGKEARVEYMDCPAEEKDIDNVTRRVHNLTQENLLTIAEYFDEKRNAILTNRVEKGFLEYRKILDVIGIHQVVTLFAAPLYSDDGSLTQVLIGYAEMKKYAIPNRYLLKEHDLVILKFASEQLHSALERLNYIELIQQMNGQLSDMAVTDQLTGLYNRQGFERIMDEWKKKLDIKKIIVYLDLDNFKYYNDTFGHELGDYILVCFARVLKDVVKKDGYAVRYGGDEFVIVLNEKDVEYAKSVVQTVFNMMIEKVNPDVQKRIGKEYIVPKEKYLTCSVGISECTKSDCIAGALNNADKALYHIKKSTKNGYVVWSELEE